MDVGGSLTSPLMGAHNVGQRMVIHFSYGGQYLKKGDEVIWSGKEDIHHALLLKNLDDELTFNVLVEKIRCKMGATGDTDEMKLSYFPALNDEKKPIYISNTIDFLCYLEPIDGRRNGVLHVETKTTVQREYRSSHASNEINVSSNNVNYGVNDVVEPCQMLEIVPYEEECEDFANIEHRECDGVRDTRVVVEEEGFPIVEWEDGMDLKKGQEFHCKEDVQILVEKASFLNCFFYENDKSDKKRYVVKCASWKNGCKWYLRAAKVKDSHIFSIRTYHKFHTCSRVSASLFEKKKRGTPRLVASLVQEQYPGRLDTPKPKGLIGIVQGAYGVKVSYSTALRGKKYAEREVRGSPEDSYRSLPSYLHMLEVSNPGTVSYLEVDEESKFKYLFFALGACIEGFQVMRKVIIVDATHLKNGYGGVLLIATAQDPNHHHYPIAFGVVDGEKDDSWLWFFMKLKIVIPDVPGLVFLSDRNQSLIKSIREVYPLSHHGYCIFHLSQNVKQHAPNTNREKVATKFRELAHVYTQTEFEILYDDFKGRYPNAAAYVEKTAELNKWARCFFPGERYNMDTTNCAESLNAVFREARHYSLQPMIDAIVDKISEWFNKHRQTSSEEHKLVPYVENILHEGIIEAQQLAVIDLNSYYLQFNVTGRDGKRYLVDLRTKTCACRHFDIDRYPCVHAIAALIEARKKQYTSMEVHELCSKFYGMEYWTLAYFRTIYPVPHMSQWRGMPTNVRALCVLPPDCVKNKGRQQVTRFPSVGESRQRRKRRNGFEEWFNCSRSETN